MGNGECNEDSGASGDSGGGNGSGADRGEGVCGQVSTGARQGIRTGVHPGPHAGANLPSLRSHNSALVLDLLRAAGGGGISRLELAESTGLTPQAVSKITARLRSEGLAAGAANGRPPAANPGPSCAWSPPPRTPSASTWTATN